MDKEDRQTGTNKENAMFEKSKDWVWKQIENLDEIGKDSDEKIQQLKSFIQNEEEKLMKKDLSVFSLNDDPSFHE